MSLAEKEIRDFVLVRDQILSSGGAEAQKIRKLRELFRLIVTTFSDLSAVQFTSLFARLSYIISSKKINYQESFLLHSFRKYEDESKLTSQDLLLAETAVNIIFLRCLDIESDVGIVHQLYTQLSKKWHNQTVSFIRELKVVIFEIFVESKTIKAQEANEPFKEVINLYNTYDK